MTRSLNVDKLIERYMDRIPGALEANRVDARYHAEIALMRKMLTVLDMIMEDEQIPEDSRIRIIRTLIYGGPDEAEALARARRYAEALTGPLSRPPSLIVGPR